MGMDKAMCAKTVFNPDNTVRKRLSKRFLMFSLLLLPSVVWAVGGPKPVERDYVTAANAPASQSPEMVAQKNEGCVSCHTESDSKKYAQQPSDSVGLCGLSRW